MAVLLNDETLMAYADGELESGAAGEVETAMAADGELARKVDEFRMTRRLARDAFASDLNEPVPAALRASVAARIAGTEGDAGSKITAWRPRNAARSWFPGASRWPMAACLAALAGTAVGYLAASGGRATDEIGVSLAGVDRSLLQYALETMPSGGERDMAGNRGRIHMIASFRNGGGELCRELSLLPGRAEPVVAVFCHDRQKWHAVFAVAAKRQDGRYAPASADPAVDAWLDAIGAGPPLSDAEEAGALGKMWE